MDAALAPRLAYYEAATARGVLAPRGWFCFGVYGSGGSSIFVTPEPIKSAFSSRFLGELVQLEHTDGETSGRFFVAQVIARVFPSERAFVDSVIETFDFFASEVTFSPYPGDKLTYRSDRVLEYSTAPDTQGLGTSDWIPPNKDSIEGLAILEGDTPNLLMLRMRLRPELKALESQIMADVNSQADKQSIR